MVLAIAVGAVLSAPLLMTPCGSSVPVESSTVFIFDGTTSLNSIQLIRSISRVETESFLLELVVCPKTGIESRTSTHIESVNFFI
jgi:hypothetical protein